jgi:hypothetical protein
MYRDMVKIRLRISIRYKFKISTFQFLTDLIHKGLIKASPLRQQFMSWLFLADLIHKGLKASTHDHELVVYFTELCFSNDQRVFSYASHRHSGTIAEVVPLGNQYWGPAPQDL